MSDSDSLDSDDCLEEAPHFHEWATTKLPYSDSAPTSIFDTEVGPGQSNQLDRLLSEHKAETEKQDRMLKIQTDMMDGTSKQEDDDESSDSDVAKEQAESLARLEVVEPELPQQHPGLVVFAPEKFGCIFSETLSLSQCGFKPSKSCIDRLLAALTEETVEDMLLSRCLPVSFHKCSSQSTVLLWLFNLMSIHSSPFVVAACYDNLAAIIQKSRVTSSKVKGKVSWCPGPAHLLKVFINWGADRKDLLVRESVCSEEQISDILTANNIDSSAQRRRAQGQMCTENLRCVFMILSLCLQSKPGLQSKELTFMFHMLSKVALDVSLRKELHVCLCALLRCYQEDQWQGEVLCICRESLHLSQHHHDQAYLAELIFNDIRDSFLQTRLSFLFLCQILLPDWMSDDVPDSSLISLEPYFITSLGESLSPSAKSRLASCLQHLVNSDVYTTISALRMLDLAVGDEQRRASFSREELEYLVDQVNLVNKSIRGGVRRLNLSKVKDMLTDLTKKWSLTVQTSKSVQKSMLSWLTPGSRQWVQPQHVQDRRMESPVEMDTNEERMSEV